MANQRGGNADMGSEAREHELIGSGKGLLCCRARSPATTPSIVWTVGIDGGDARIGHPSLRSDKR